MKKKIDFSKMKVSSEMGTKIGVIGKSDISGNCYTCDSADGANSGDWCDCHDGGSDED